MPVRIPTEQYERLKELRKELGGVGTATYGEVIETLIENYEGGDDE